MPTFTLKAARVNAGYTQKQVIEILGISNGTLVNWERGTTQPNATYINEMCKLYGRKIEELNFFPKNPDKKDLF